MHAIVAIVGVGLIALMLAEFFNTFLLPRRVKRDPRLARGLLRWLWRPWRAVAARLADPGRDTLLGVFGPLWLITVLAVLSAGVIIGFAALHWAFSSHLAGTGHPDFGGYLYLSGGIFFSASTPAPTGGFGKTMQVLEAANGFGFLAIAIGYLPALFQAFSRRETAVSRLDPRAGSPPTAAALLERSSQRGGWRELDAYLREWETWTAELMETHLGYPVLAYFRSQHVGQNWLAALTTVVDACAYALAYGPAEDTEAAELTFRIGRHALADLSYVLNRGGVARSLRQERRRLVPESLRELRRRLENTGLHSQESDEAARRLEELRDSYEPYAIAISNRLSLPLPDWLPPQDVREYWRLTTGRRALD